MGSGVFIWAIIATFVAVLAIGRLVHHSVGQRREAHGSKAQQHPRDHRSKRSHRGRGSH
jgi:heme exporter protein D